MGDIVAKFKNYLTSQNISVYRAERDLGVSNGMLGKLFERGGGLKSDLLENILMTYPDFGKIINKKAEPDPAIWELITVIREEISILNNEISFKNTELTARSSQIDRQLTIIEALAGAKKIPDATEADKVAASLDQKEYNQAKGTLKKNKNA